ncbi:MAG TPA: hypothetical protein VIR54_17730 [Vicinamibacterales bacterium]
MTVRLEKTPIRPLTGRGAQPPLGRFTLSVGAPSTFEAWLALPAGDARTIAEFANDYVSPPPLTDAEVAEVTAGARREAGLS